MIPLVKKGFYWLLDYVYVIKTEISVYFQNDTADMYRNVNGAPVILLPGVFENWRFIRPIAKLLYEHGYDVHVLDELGYNTGSIEEMAERVRAYCKKYMLKDISLIAHSKGGLIGKQLLIDDIPQQLFAHLITLNTPFAGSRYATYLPLKSLRIFSPHSSTIKRLLESASVNERITAIYGLFDPHIPRASGLKGARNIQLKTYGHFRPISDKKVHELFLSILKGQK